MRRRRARTARCRRRLGEQPCHDLEVEQRAVARRSRPRASRRGARLRAQVIALPRSDSRTISASISRRILRVLALCTVRQACVASCAGIAPSQSSSLPSASSAERARARSSCAPSPPRLASGVAAASQSSSSVPAAPSRSSVRICRSCRSTFLRRRSPAMPAGAILFNAASSIAESERAYSPSAPGATSTTGKS